MISYNFLGEKLSVTIENVLFYFLYYIKALAIILQSLKQFHFHILLLLRRIGRSIEVDFYFDNVTVTSLRSYVTVTGPLGLWMFERPGELRLNHSNVNFNYFY